MKSTSLWLDLRVGERLSIDDGRIIIILEQKSGQRAKIRVVAEQNVKIGSPQPMNDPPARLVALS